MRKEPLRLTLPKKTNTPTAAGTCSATVSMLKKWGTNRIVVIGVVGTIQGACVRL